MISASVSKLNKLFVGYFDTGNIFLDIENKYFPGWANQAFGLKKEPLVMMLLL